MSQEIHPGLIRVRNMSDDAKLDDVTKQLIDKYVSNLSDPRRALDLATNDSEVSRYIRHVVKRLITVVPEEIQEVIPQEKSSVRKPPSPEPDEDMFEDEPELEDKPRPRNNQRVALSPPINSLGWFALVIGIVMFVLGLFVRYVYITTLITNIVNSSIQFN